MQKLLTFLQQKNCVYAIFNDQSFNDMLTNNIVSFEQWGPHVLFFFVFFYFSMKTYVVGTH